MCYECLMNMKIWSDEKYLVDELFRSSLGLGMMIKVEDGMAKIYFSSGGTSLVIKEGVRFKFHLKQVGQ